MEARPAVHARSLWGCSLTGSRSLTGESSWEHPTDAVRSQLWCRVVVGWTLGERQGCEDVHRVCIAYAHPRLTETLNLAFHSHQGEGVQQLREALKILAERVLILEHMIGVHGE